MLLADLTARSQTILRLAVDAYLASGEPVGSSTLAHALGQTGSQRGPAWRGPALSAATIRAAMADLEEAGLLYAPHVSAGRLPTAAGVRLFVDGLLEVGQLDPSEQRDIEQHFDPATRNDADPLNGMFERASTLLSGLSRCAGLVAAPAPVSQPGLRQIEFVALGLSDQGTHKILVVLVRQDGRIENRLIDTAEPLPAGVLARAGAYLNARLTDRNQPIERTAETIRQEIRARQTDIDALTAQLVEAGLVESLDALQAPHQGLPDRLIVRGKAHLLNDIKQLDELERLRRLFDTLEERQTLLNLVERTQSADGVQIFIGAENAWFDHAGCSLITAPYKITGKNKQQHIVGALGVIGPTRMAYGRIIPVVDFTARLLTQLLQGR